MITYDGIVIKEMTLKELIYIANENWGYKDDTVDGPHVASVIDIIFNGVRQTRNISSIPHLAVYNPFIPFDFLDKKQTEPDPKVVGIFTLNEFEIKRIIKSGYFKAKYPKNCEIALKLYKKSGK
jgi:hypothetical protein